MSGTAEGYSYSEAMQTNQLVLDQDKLFLFLENPKKWVPGTKMVFAGLKKEQDRADLISYLKVATQ